MKPVASFGTGRSGFLETVDVAWPGYGANFRLVMESDGEKFNAVTSVPGGNFNFLNPGWMSELMRYTDGSARPLVRFVGDM